MAVLLSVAHAVRARGTRERWEAAWSIMERSTQAGVDLGLPAAQVLARAGRAEWGIPKGIRPFAELLREAGILGGGAS